MPIDRYMRNKGRSELTRFGLVGGVRADTSPGVTPVLDSNNVFPSPDGSEMLPRDGVEIRKRYRFSTDPTGRKVIFLESAPPDVELGFLIGVIDTAGGKNRLEKAQFMRDRTQLPLNSQMAIVYVLPEISDGIPPLPLIVLMRVYRTGNLDIPAIVRYRTVDGTATSPTDYGGIDDVITIDAGEAESAQFGVEIFATCENKYFTVELYNPGPRTVISDGSFDGVSTGITVVNIT